MYYILKIHIYSQTEQIFQSFINNLILTVMIQKAGSDVKKMQECWLNCTFVTSVRIAYVSTARSICIMSTLIYDEQWDELSVLTIIILCWKNYGKK